MAKTGRSASEPGWIANLIQDLSGGEDRVTIRAGGASIQDATVTTAGSIKRGDFTFAMARVSAGGGSETGVLFSMDGSMSADQFPINETVNYLRAKNRTGTVKSIRVTG